MPRRIATFAFTGDGAEYFRIWVVNLLLTIVTLGIYSAWAKVRKTRYFCQNTRLEGHAFDYHGDPRAILLGRIIALVLLLGYTFAFDISRATGAGDGRRAVRRRPVAVHARATLPPREQQLAGPALRVRRA